MEPARIGLTHMGMPLEVTSRLLVRCDGVPIKNCYAADDRQGWCLRIHRDERGCAHLRPDGQGLVYEVLTGDVSIQATETPTWTCT